MMSENYSWMVQKEYLTYIHKYIYTQQVNLSEGESLCFMCYFDSGIISPSLQLFQNKKISKLRWLIGYLHFADTS